MTKAASTAPDLIGTAEAAEIIGIDRSTLTRLADRGEIPSIRPVPGIRSPLLFARADVEALRDERRERAS